MKKILILGNGKSRLDQKEFINNWLDEIWVCNTAFQECKDLPKISAIGTVHQEVAIKAYNFRIENNLIYNIFSPMQIKGIKVRQFIKYNGWSTGNELLQQALLEGYAKIYLLGFDFGGGDIYQPNSVVGTNFLKQFNKLIKTYGSNRIEIVGKQIQTDKTNPIVIPVSENLKKIINIDKKSVCIVGNSPNILKYDYKDIIDSFDTVVRLNDYQIEGYEKKVGIKEDIWFSGASAHCKVKRRKLTKDNHIICPGITRFRLKEKDMILDIKKSLQNFNEELNILPKDIVQQIHNITGLDYCSTGFMAIIYFSIILKKEVSIIGFDFFQEYKKHYYDKNKLPVALSIGHNFIEEKKIIEDYIKKDVIKVLSLDTKIVDPPDVNYEYDKEELNYDNEIDLDKTCFFTLLTDDYIEPFEVYMHSLIKHNTWFNLDFVILDYNLSDTTKKKLIKIYSNVKFMKVKDPSKYDNIDWSKTHDILKVTYYKLEVFNIRDYDKVIMTDVDMLVLGDISGAVFDRRTGILGTKCFSENLNELVSDVNTGFIIITKEHLNDKTFIELLDFVKVGFNLPDQKGINRFFKGKIKYLAKKYNVSKRMATHNTNPDIEVPFDDIRILHYVGANPWTKNKIPKEQNYYKMEKLWFNELAELRDNFNKNKLRG